jgi:hypothetical protein
MISEGGFNYKGPGEAMTSLEKMYKNIKAKGTEGQVLTSYEAVLHMSRDNTEVAEVKAFFDKYNLTCPSEDKLFSSDGLIASLNEDQ